MVEVPSMEASREADNTIPAFPPNAKPEHDFIMTQVSVVVHGQHRFRLDSVVWKEAIVKCVTACSNQLQDKSKV